MTVIAAPEPVAPRDFAETLRAHLEDPRTRLLHLTHVPGVPGIPAGEPGLVLAVYEGAQGLGALAAPAVLPTRPSRVGVAAAAIEEWRLELDGLRWAEEASERAILGRGVFTFPLGPVRADVAESAGWRFSVMGDEVLGLHLRFGYKRRHLEQAMGATTPSEGVLVAERVTGTSPLAHALAYANAWEAALRQTVPPPATYWRAVMAELERLHSHLGDLASLANATGLPAAAAELYVLKEQVLRLCLRLTGHRYQRGAITVGGLARTLAPIPDLPRALQAIHGRFGLNIAELDRSTSFLDRLHTAGRVPPEAVQTLHPVGPTGRACGLPYDVRTDVPYSWYAAVGAPPPVVENTGDSWARYRVRVREVRSSLRWLLERLEEGVPTGSAQDPGSPVSGLCVARVEAPRGELLYIVCPGPVQWVRVRPASAVNWAVVPPAVGVGNVLQDVPIIDASFSLSVAALDR